VPGASGFGRGVSRAASGSLRSSRSIETAAASATPAATPNAAVGDRLSSAAPPVGAAASPIQKHSPATAMYLPRRWAGASSATSGVSAVVCRHSPTPATITATIRTAYAIARLASATSTSRQAPQNNAPASAIVSARRRPSANLATGTWATTTAMALASSSSPISEVLSPIWFRAKGGSSQLNTPQPTAIIATSATARWRKARSRSSTRYPPRTGSRRGLSCTTAASTAT
jgi:hypothetical protein